MFSEFYRIFFFIWFFAALLQLAGIEPILGCDFTPAWLYWYADLFPSACNFTNLQPQQL